MTLYWMQLGNGWPLAQGLGSLFAQVLALPACSPGMAQDNLGFIISLLAPPLILLICLSLSLHWHFLSRFL
jgi:hypothetical protein